ncbi:diaminopropionate ammonia-lyase [Actinomadura sp. HBU206391]|uniref:diaminopropionate ammonia-lyase n=1 Tax=Actinomadura sp. HBU206391 TaxID=2731692 RepID=UPI0016505678|nr:diaminopropionate ammonia-lyase [Actinomadura sp. HBU206391]MBC6461522.1 diaminopropionate ammonia-lyase [Actinomadura sp. HBU206391]
MHSTPPVRAHAAPDAVPRPPWYARPAARTWTCAPAPREVRDFHATLPGFAPTPLTEVPALAAELGVGRVFVKDESARLGLPAFKVLGAAWAIHRALSEHVGGTAPETLDELRERLATRPPVRLVTATDGNHGRAVAHIARLLGLPAGIFVAGGVHPAAVGAIAAEGAEVTRVPGSYDDTVRRARLAAEQPSSVLLQDTAWPGYEEVPGWIVAGYSTLFAEIDEQLDASGAEAAGLVAVPVGVGSLAQAAVAHYRSRPARRPPSLLAVEPDVAACVLASLTEGRPRTVNTGTTIMAGLNCGTPSSLAWPYLRDGLDAAVAVTDAESARAAGDLGAFGVSSGPCGAASLAGLRWALTGADGAARRESLAVGGADTVVLLSTEGTAANQH